ncbi:MAG: TIGR01777 family protein [Planctomycetaceae bacterium]|nr:TIGR01777 family protein [Planctomycetaceae bacterium]MBP62348.1 TIGR01777 family protein [Planctomycetaceae bacterium]
MKVAVSGASGLVGSALLKKLKVDQHEVVPLVRDTAGGADGASWDPDGGAIESEKLEGLQAVVHLAGENIATGRWTAEKKRKIRDSRVRGTTFLSETLTQLQQPPATLIAASAIGVYGNRGDELCDETTPAAEDFLADVCREWEASTRVAQEAGIRVVNLRIGVVLSTEGGALAKMLFPFKMGGGGRVGSGQQIWSWITLDDLVGVVMHCLDGDSLAGPVNAVSPNSVTNAEFTKALGKTLRRPTLLPMPAFLARLLFGEMGEMLILSSTHVLPRKLEQTGYQFQHPDIHLALEHLLLRT